MSIPDDASLALASATQCHRGFDLREDSSSVLEETLAARQQMHAAGRAAKELGPEFVLEALDLAGQWRL